MKKQVPLTAAVVVTGLGVVSSLGIGWQAFWKNLLAGKSGISKITTFDTSQYDRHYGGEVKNFDPIQFISRKKAERLGRTSQMAIAASILALKDGKLVLKKKIDRDRMGVFVGTTAGEIQILEELNDYKFKSRRKFNSSLMLVYPASSLSVNVSLEHKFNNRSYVFPTACASGNYALGYAFDQIRSSKLDYALAGGADAFSRIVFTGFGRLYAIAPEKCQPFDKNRQGMIPGEGAGMLLLESLETARKRRAPIYAEVLGYGMSCDAYDMTEPSVAGITHALQNALRNSGVKTGQVDYVSAHGTGTVENDEAECQAINRVFGKKTLQIPISAIKSMLGHTMGASSAFGAIACCLAIKDGHIPPTINHEKDDSKCNIDCVPNKSRRQRVKIVLNNSQAFGGNNSCISIRKY